MARYRITPRARDDLRNIARYTLQQWGKTQRDTYLKRLEMRFGWLADNPRLGKHRFDIHEDYFSFPEGRHVVFYLIHAEAIDIIGVLHGHMDIINHFSAM